MRARPLHAGFMVGLLAAAAPAEVVRILECDDEAAQARIDLIQQARESIDVQYFIYGNDPVALAGLALLRDAARRGVRVRLVVDAFYNKIPPGMRAHLAHEGVEVRDYHPFDLSTPRWWLRRMHDKLLVVDGTQMITGGRNVESSYFGRHRGRNYVDRDVYVKGAVVRHATTHFQELWDSKHVATAQLAHAAPRWRELRLARYTNPLVREHHARVRAMANREIADAQQLLDALMALRDAPVAGVRTDTGTDWAQGHRDLPGVRFLHDRGGRKGHPGINEALVEILDGARESVEIESPYCIPSAGLLVALGRARERGVAVRILTNSFSSTDNVLAQAGYVHHKAELVARYGVSLWEARGPASLHAKSMVIDSRTVVIGTYNLNPRSQYYDTELAVVVEDPVLARDLATSMHAHLAEAYAIGEDGRPLHPVAPPPATLRQVWMRLLALVTPLIHAYL